MPYLNGQSGILYTQNNEYRRNLISLTSSTQPYSIQKLIIGKNGRMNDLIITNGVSKYNGNFSVPIHQHKGLLDDHVTIGPTYDVSKTTYSSYQYTMLKNPITNNNWTVPEISGMILGVKKL